MRWLLTSAVLLGLLAGLGATAPASGRGRVPTASTVSASGDAYDPGPLDATASDVAAPPLPAGAGDPLQSIVDDADPSESVIGADGRAQVTDTTAYPSAAIGQLTFTQRGTTYLCSGFLIDPNTVLTAGHCVHEGGPLGVYSDDVDFTPGRDGTTAPFGSCGASAVEASPGWLASADEEEDFGWIQLECLIGELVGWLGYGAAGDITGATAEVRGYPADQAPGTMWTMGGTIAEVTAGQAFYLMDTYGGQSGSPVFDPDRPACGGPCALAVHGYGVHGTPPHDSSNHGARLDEARAAAIAAAAAANDREDLDAPTVTVTAPADGATYPAGAWVAAAYSCTDGPTGSGIRSCGGTAAEGALVDTSPGTHTFTVEGEDGAGNTTLVQVDYTIRTRLTGPIPATPTFTG